MSSNILIDRINANRVAQANGATAPSIENQSGNPLIDRINYNRANPKTKEDTAAANAVSAAKKHAVQEHNNIVNLLHNDDAAQSWAGKATQQYEDAQANVEKLRAKFDEANNVNLEEKYSRSNDDRDIETRQKEYEEEKTNRENLKKALAQAEEESKLAKSKMDAAQKVVNNRNAVREVENAVEKGASYKSQYDAYSQSLEELNKQKVQLTEQLSKIRNGSSYYGAASTYEQDKARQEADEKEATDRLEKLEREIERLEGTRAYARQYLTKDAGAKAVIRQGEELARTAKEKGTEIADSNRAIKKVTDYFSIAPRYGTARNIAEIIGKLFPNSDVIRDITGAIGNLPEAYNPLSFIAELGIRAGENTPKTPNDNWSQDQLDLYHFFYGNPDYGKEAAEKYAQMVNYAMNTASVNAQTKADYAVGASKNNGFLKTVGGLVGAVPDMALAAGDAQNKLLDILAAGTYAGHDTATAHERFSAFSQGRADTLNSKTLSESIPVIGGKGWGDLYQLGQSALQSISSGHILGEAATLGAFFVNAANSAFDEAMQRTGGNTQYAATFSLLSGAAEVIGEKVSLDHLLKGGKVGSLSFLLKQAGIEGSEEVGTSLLNQFFDSVAAKLTGEQAATQSKIAALVRSGMSYDDAEKQVWKQAVNDLAWDFVGGAVSGFASGGVESVVRRTGNKLWDMRKDSVLGKQNAEGKREGGKNASAEQLRDMFQRALNRGDLRGAEQILEELDKLNATEEPQEYGPADPNADERVRRRLERQLNGESLNSETENAEYVEESETNRGLAEEAKIQEQFPTLNPITMRNIERLSIKDLVTAAKTMTTDELAEAERYARFIGEDAKADALHAVWENPAYRYQEQGNEEKPFPGDEDDPMRYAPKNGAGAQEAPGGQITKPSQQNAAQTVKPSDYGVSQSSGKTSTAMVNDMVDRMPEHRNFDYSTIRTGSGTMSVPNTQEVNNNAGEQTVRADEEAEAADFGVGRRPAGAGAATGQYGMAQETTASEQGAQSGTERSAEKNYPRFVTEEDLATLSDTEESSPISAEQKEEYKQFEPLLNDGTYIVSKPRIGTRLHLAMKLAKKLKLNMLFGRNANTSVYKDGASGYQNGNQAVIDADTTLMEVPTAVAHEAGHIRYNGKFGGFSNIVNGAFSNRLRLFTNIFNNALGEARGKEVMSTAEKFVREEKGYENKYRQSRNRLISRTNEMLVKSGRFLSQDSKKLVSEMEQARAVEEFLNQVLASDYTFLDGIQRKTDITWDEIYDIRDSLCKELVAAEIFDDGEIAAIDDAITALDEEKFTEDYDDDDEFNAADFKGGGLKRAVNALLRGDAEAIGRLSVDDLNYAINYTLKKANPDLDFKEKRRTYNAIANVLSGMNIDTFGYDRNVARNESNDKNNAGFDGMMSKAPNKLFYAISSRAQSDGYDDGRRGMDTIGNLQPGQYRPMGSAGSMQTVLRNALNELDRRGLNIWGKESSNRFEYDEETDDTGKQYERSDESYGASSDYSSRYNSATYGDSRAEDDYSDEYNEGAESRESKLRAKDQKAAEKREATSALRRLREGDNWLEGAVKVNPEAKEWGRGAKETAGQKTQGWYDINRRSSLSEREFARQRVMNARAAEDLSYEIQTMEDQASDIREEIELARRNSPAAKESLRMINSFLEELNDDIDDLHAIDDMFRDAVREDPNSDMTKQLAAEGTRLSSEIENLRRDIDTLGRLANESIASNNSEELRDAEKRLRKQEQKIKTRREHLKKLLDESHGGDKSGALVASRAETAFDSMPDDVIKQIIRNGYVSMDMLQDYYGNADAAYQTMYEFQERVGETGKTRVPSVHKLTSLEKTALHGILADRKKAGKITSGYGGIEQDGNLPEAFGRQSEPDVVDDNYDIESARDIARRAEAGEFDINGSKSTKHKPSTPQAATSASISERNRLAYQESMRTGVELEANEPTPESMDRLNRMFAERLGIENKGNTAVSVVDNEFNAADFGEPARGMGTGYRGMQRSRNKDGSLEFRTMYDDAPPARPATDKPRKPLNQPSTAYGNVAQAARSILNSKNSFFDFSEKRPKDIPSKVTNAMGQLYSHVREMMEGEHPVNALMQLSNLVHEFANDDDLKMFTSNSIQHAVDELNDIYYNQDITNEEKAQRMVENATKTLTLISKRAQLVDRSYTMLKAFKGPRKKRDSTTFWSKFKAMQLNPSTLFKAMDGFDRRGGGSGYKIAKMIENGTALYTITQTQALKRLSEISGLEGFKEFAEGNEKPFDIDGVRITEQQAVEFIMQVRNLLNTEVTGKNGPTNRLNTIDGFSIKDKNGKNVFLERSDDADGTNAEWFKSLAEGFENSLSPAAKKYLETATEILDDLGQQASDIRTNLIGTGFEGSINGTYYPITYDNKNGTTYSQQDRPTSLADGPMYQSRTRNVGGYVSIKNASDTLDKYIHWASNFIGYGEVAELLHAMDNTGSRMQNLSGLANETLGQGYSDYITKFVNDVNENSENPKNEFLAKIRQNMASGALLGNLGVAAKQAASLWSGVGVLSPQSLLAAETWFGGHSGSGSMLLQSRATGTSIDPSISEILHNDSFMGKLMKRSGVGELMGKATALVDYQTVKRLFAATVVDTKLSFPGMDQNSELFARVVEAKFQDVVLQTQPIFVKNARAGYLRSSDELMKAIAMFRTQPTQNLNAIATAIGEYKALKGTDFGKAAGKKLRNTIIGQASSAFTFALLSSIVGFARHSLKKYRDDDDELSWAEVAKRIGLDTAESLAGISVFGGDLAKAIITMATGGEEKEFYDLNAGVLSMVADTASSVTTFGTNLVKAITEGKSLAVFNAGRQAADNIMQVGLGIPANTVYRLLNAATMYTADAMYALSDGKLGNRANYDDAMKMLDSYIKGNLTEEGAKKQAAKAFRKDQPENLLYNLGILSSLTSKESKVDKGTDWLNDRIQGKTEEERKAYKEDELARLGRNLNSGERIANYLADSALSAAKKDEAISRFATTSGYNVLYESLRAAGMTPEAAVEELGKTDNKTGLSTDIRSDDSLADLYAGKDNPGETNDVPALDKKNTDEYVNFVSAMKVFRDTGNYSQLDKLVDQYSRLDENTRAVIEAKDSTMKKYREYRSMGFSTKDYYNVKDAIKQAQIDLDLSANTGTTVKLVGLSRTNLTKAQMKKLIESESLGISKTGKSLISVLSKYGYTIGDVGMFMYNTDWTNDDANGTLSQQEVVLALAKEKRLTDAQRSAIYEELKTLLRNEYKINHWYDKSYEYELNYLLQNGKTSGRAS